MRQCIALLAFFVIAGACIDGAIVAYEQIHHSPVLEVMGCLLGIAIAVFVSGRIVRGTFPYRSNNVRSRT